MMATVTTALKEPTLAGVLSAQEQHLTVLHDLERRVRSIAEHLVGAEPGQPSGGVDHPPSGVIRILDDQARFAAGTVEQVISNVRRIERAIGIPHPDEAMAADGPQERSYATPSGGGLRAR